MLGSISQALVTRPELRARCEQRPCQQMRIDVANATSEQPMILYEGMNFFIAGDESRGQSTKRLENDVSLPKAAQCQLPNYEGMGKNLPPVEQLGKGRIVMSKMIDPDRSVDQDHAGSGRRRGGASP